MLDDDAVVLLQLAQPQLVEWKRLQSATNLLISHDLSYRDISDILGTLVGVKQGAPGRGLKVEASNLWQRTCGAIFLYYFNRHYKVPGFGYYVAPDPPQQQQHQQQSPVQFSPRLVRAVPYLAGTPTFQGSSISFGDLTLSLPTASKSAYSPSTVRPESTARHGGSGQSLSPSKTKNNISNNNTKNDKKSDKEALKSNPIPLAPYEAIGPGFAVRTLSPDGKPKGFGKGWLKVVEGKGGNHDNKDNNAQDYTEKEREDNEDDETEEVCSGWEWVLQ
jgi:hypothetical protein